MVDGMQWRKKRTSVLRIKKAVRWRSSERVMKRVELHDKEARVTRSIIFYGLDRDQRIEAILNLSVRSNRLIIS
jgi:hypothetical protein